MRRFQERLTCEVLIPFEDVVNFPKSNTRATMYVVLR
jgi:hypothetical protein